LWQRQLAQFEIALVPVRADRSVIGVTHVRNDTYTVLANDTREIFPGRMPSLPATVRVEKIGVVRLHWRLSA
jgi:hypothetical protein